MSQELLKSYILHNHNDRFTQKKLMIKLVDESTSHTYQRVFSEVKELKYYRHYQEDNTHNYSQRLRPTKKSDEMVKISRQKLFDQTKQVKSDVREIK